MADLIQAVLTPVPETPVDIVRPVPKIMTALINKDHNDDLIPIKSNFESQSEPFAPPALSESQSDSGIEGNETSDALTGAAVSLATARARLRQASIGNFANQGISDILRDLETLASKLDDVIHDISDQSRGQPESPLLHSDEDIPPAANQDTISREYSGISDFSEIARLRGMRGALEIGNDFDEAVAAQEISDLRRVRRQLRYLFALENRKLEVEISDPVVTTEVVSSRRMSSREWAQSLVEKIRQ